MGDPEFSLEQLFSNAKCKITLDDEELQQVESFNNLGSALPQDHRCNSDITLQIALAKSPLQTF